MISISFSLTEDEDSKSFNKDINNGNFSLENNKNIINYSSIKEDNLQVNKLSEPITNNNLFFDSLYTNEFPNLFAEEKSTLIKTKSKGYNQQIPILSIKNEDKEKILPDFYSINLILEKIGENINEPKLKNILLELSQKKTIQDSYEYNFMEFLKRKRKRKKENKNNPEENQRNEEPKKRGRKRKKYKENGKHNKMSHDNIIKKIKSKILNFILLNFLNKLLLILEEKEKLIKLDSKYIKNLKKDFDLKLLKMPLKDLYSLNISDKYKKDKNHNKVIIKGIMKKINEKKQKSLEDDTIIFVLNMSYENIIDIFINKKKIEDFIDIYDTRKNEICNIIKGNLLSVEDLFIDLLNDNGEKYTLSFLFYLYNLKRYFLLKKRTNKENIESKYDNLI